MKGILTLCFVLLFGFGMVACSEQKSDGKSAEQPKTEIKEEAIVPEPPAAVEMTGTLADLSWMIGRWRQQEAEGVYSDEIWTKSSGESLSGSAHTIQNGDTIWSEKLEIKVEENGEVVYYATVPQNDGPVGFKMVAIAPYTATFENPKHDFPWKIVYTLDADTMNARIAGFKNGQAAANDLVMVRVE